MKLLFLDDFRWPTDCAKYMHVAIGPQNIIYTNPNWDVVRNYPEFVSYIERNGLPELISFDHDLADGHYHTNMQEGVLNYQAESFGDDFNKTGYHCAQWLVNYCMDNSKPLPEFLVHSMNPVGTVNIQSLLDNFKQAGL